MQTRDKWIIVIMTIVMISTGLSYYAIAHNDTTVTDTPTTIIVNGNGSSGTGDVSNTQIVQVQQEQIVTTAPNISTTKPTQTVLVGESYKPEE